MTSVQGLNQGFSFHSHRKSCLRRKMRIELSKHGREATKCPVCCTLLPAREAVYYRAVVNRILTRWCSCPICYAEWEEYGTGVRVLHPKGGVVKVAHHAVSAYLTFKMHMA